MYRLHVCGPDDRSTYPIVFGLSSRNGPVKAESRTLVGLLEAVLALGHNNFAVWRGRTCVAQARHQFFALPTVARHLAQSEG